MFHIEKLILLLPAILGFKIRIDHAGKSYCVDESGSIILKSANNCGEYTMVKGRFSKVGRSNRYLGIPEGPCGINRYGRLRCNFTLRKSNGPLFIQCKENSLCYKGRCLSNFQLAEPLFSFGGTCIKFSTTDCPADAPIPDTSYLPGTEVIQVFKQEDVYLRMKKATTTHVTMEIQNNLVHVNWNLNASFSNTTFVSKCGIPVVLSADKSVTPISVWDAENIFIHNLIIQSYYKAGATEKCLDNKLVKFSPFNRIKYDIRYTPICPAVLLANCKNVQVVQNSIRGKLMLYKTSNTYVDGNTITTHNLDYGIFTGHIGDWITLEYPLTMIRNNIIFENNVGIMVAGTTGPSVGIQILNNNITSFKWASVQFGFPASHGAQHCRMAHNYISVPESYKTDFESSYVFMNTYWIGFNNSIQYNYFKANTAGLHGFYMAFGTSGTVITNNVLDGVRGVPLKLHTGKYNLIKDNLMYKSGPIWPIQCIFSHNEDNCGNTQYMLPWAFGNNNFTSPAWKKLIPFANGQPRDICNLREINGIKCNPTAADDKKYFNCSGIPWKNIVYLTTVAGHNALNFVLPLPKALDQGLSCNGETNAPNVDILNVFTDVNYGESYVTRSSDGLLKIVRNSKLDKDVPELSKFPYVKLGAKNTVGNFFQGIKPRA